MSREAEIILNKKYKTAEEWIKSGFCLMKHRHLKPCIGSLNLDCALCGFKNGEKNYKDKIDRALIRLKTDFNHLDYCGCGYSNLDGDTILDLIKILEGE